MIKFAHNDLTRKLLSYGCSTKAELASTLEDALPIYMEENGPGLVLLVYSMVFTRGVVSPSCTRDNAAAGASTESATSAASEGAAAGGAGATACSSGGGSAADSAGADTAAGVEAAATVISIGDAACSGCDTIFDDMDTEITVEPSLIGSDDFCNQDIVNLFLTGRATSFPFDGEVTVGADESGTGKPVKLRGVGARPHAGLLSWQEAWTKLSNPDMVPSETACVGDFLKRPILPIWVYQAFSHYTMIFVPPPHLAFASSRMPANGHDMIGGAPYVVDSSKYAGAACFEMCGSEPGAFEVHMYDELGSQTGMQVLTVRVQPTGSTVPPFGEFVSQIDAMAASLRGIWPTALVEPGAGFLPWASDGIVRADAMKVTGAGLVLT